LENAREQLRTIVSSRNLWIALLFIGLFYFSPGFGTPLFYRQTEELHFSKQAIGNLGVFSGASAILAAIIYSQLIKRVKIRFLLLISIVLNALGTLLYLFYSDYPHAVLIDSQNGFFFALAEIHSSTSPRVRPLPSSSQERLYRILEHGPRGLLDECLLNVS
jgi:MFS-type transporter involved in bile tolerance (Atg22 family)